MPVHTVRFEPVSIRSGVAQAAAGLQIEVTVPPLRDERRLRRETNKCCVSSDSLGWIRGDGGKGWVQGDSTSVRSSNLCKHASCHLPRLGEYSQSMTTFHGAGGQ